MTIDELVLELQRLRRVHGNLEVAWCGYLLGEDGSDQRVPDLCVVVRNAPVQGRTVEVVAISAGMHRLSDLAS